MGTEILVNTAAAKLGRLAALLNQAGELLFERLLLNQAGELLFERLTLASELLKDEDWIATSFGNIDKAANALEKNYLGDLCGAVQFWRLIALRDRFKTIEDWRKHNFNITALSAIFDKEKPKKPGREITRISLKVAPNNEEERSNKAKHIRDALDVLGDEAKPIDVVDWIKQQRGVEVTTAYVSLIKSQARKQTKQYTAQEYLAARALVRAAGSVAQAKMVLNSLDNDKDVVVAVKDRYSTLLQEAEAMLEDSKLKKSERRELVLEVRKLRRLITSLGDVETGVS